MDESRRQFEKCWDDYTGSPDGRCKSLRSGTGYRNKAANECWEFWRASRQSIEIETPTRINEIHLRQPKEVEDMWLHRLKFAVESAGLKIKGE